MAKCVLLVDDDSFCLMTLSAMMSSNNIKIITATNGKEALDVYKVFFLFINFFNNFLNLKIFSKITSK